VSQATHKGKHLCIKNGYRNAQNYHCNRVVKV